MDLGNERAEINQLRIELLNQLARCDSVIARIDAYEEATAVRHRYAILPPSPHRPILSRSVDHDAWPHEMRERATPCRHPGCFRETWNVGGYCAAHS